MDHKPWWLRALHKELPPSDRTGAITVHRADWQSGRRTFERTLSQVELLDNNGQPVDIYADRIESDWTGTADYDHAISRGLDVARETPE